MIHGIGVDVCHISRIEKKIDDIRFIERIFTVNEKEYAFKTIKPALHLAGAFAAKEAFLKARGIGLWSFPLNKVGVIRRDSGKPEIEVLDDKLTKSLCVDGIKRIFVSITHEYDIAVAMVVMEGE